MKLTDEMVTNLNLTEEQKTKLTELLADDEQEQGKTVEVLNNRITTLETDIKERDKQLKKLSQGNTSLEELQEQINTLKENSAKQIKEYQKKLQAEQINHAISLKLSPVVKDIDIVSKFIEKDKLVINGDKVVGIDEQVENLKAKYSYLFKDGDNMGGKTPPPIEPKYEPNTGGNGGANNPFAKETYNLTEQAKLMTQDPVRARELASAVGVNID